MIKENIKCEFCKNELFESNFYKIITEKINEVTGKYEPYAVCKKCIARDYFLNQTSVFQHDVKYICEKYNLYYDINIVERIMNSDIKDYKIGNYIKEISSLRQYIDKKYKDSIFEKVDNNIDNSTEKSDIDFLDDDIVRIKKNMKQATFQNDANAHGKWMNSLREALELKEKLLLKENKVSINSLNDLKVDYGVFEGKDINGETVGIVPIFINSHYIRSAYIKYVDGKYEMTEYITDKL